jgi:hypothetical protein
VIANLDIHLLLMMYISSLTDYLNHSHISGMGLSFVA